MKAHRRSRYRLLLACAAMVGCFKDLPESTRDAPAAGDGRAGASGADRPLVGEVGHVGVDQRDLAGADVPDAPPVERDSAGVESGTGGMPSVPSGGTGGGGAGGLGGRGGAGGGAGGTGGAPACVPASCNLPNATATCASGACAVASCASGYGDCTPSPGCETPTTTVQNCGRCGTVCDVPVNGRATCVSGQCGFDCIAPKVKCGSVCVECCGDADCKPGANETGACSSNRTCSFQCKPDSSRCRSTCRTPKVLGACVVSTTQPPLTMYWCDPMEGERHSIFTVTVPKLIESGYDINDPDVVEKDCLNNSDDLTIQYCTYSPTYAPARKARMDTVYVYTVKFDADGKLVKVQMTANARSRTCMP